MVPDSATFEYWSVPQMLNDQTILADLVAVEDGSTLVADQAAQMKVLRREKVMRSKETKDTSSSSWPLNSVKMPHWDLLSMLLEVD